MAERAYRYDFGYDANAAVQPKRKPEIQRQPELQVIVNPLAKEIAREREVNIIALKLSALILAVLVALAGFCYSFVEVSDAQHKLAEAEKNLTIHQAQNEELKADLNALVAGVDIERYAVEHLGLIKVSAENEFYINKTAGNKIVFSAETE